MNPAVRPPKLLLVIFLTNFLLTTSTPAQDATRSSGWVVIPLATRAYPVDREPDGPPVEATLSRVGYQRKVTGDLAAGKAL